MILKNTKLIALTVLLFLPFLGLSQAPELFNYQAVVRDISGTLITNDEVDFRFTIRSGSTTGTIEYQEVHPLIMTNDFGLVNLIIGQGNYIAGNFSTIDWGNNMHYIEVELDPESDGSFLVMGTPQLISVPYALHAGNTFSGDYNDLINTPIDNDTDSLNELQQLTFVGTDLSITNGNTVDLSSLQDGTGTDDQNISGSALNGTNLTIGIEGGSSETIDLSSLQDGTGTDNQNISGSTLNGTDLTIGIEGGNSEVIDLSSLQDGTGTDDQNIAGSALNGTNLTIGIEGGNSEIIDLSSLQDGTGTDDQNISGSALNGTNLTIGIEGGNSEIIDLSSLQDGTGTDDQNISGSALNGTNLTIGIEGGSSEIIDLSSLQDGTGTDDQNISGSALNGTDLTIGIEGGNSEVIDLSSLQDGTGTDDQQLTLTGTNLSIEDGNSVDLSGLDTDDQTLSLSGTDLTITDGNTIDLSSLQDGTGTDDQNISGSALNGTDLTIGIEGGNSEVIDLSSLQDGTGTDDQNISGSALNGTDLTIGIEGGNSETIDLSSLQDGVIDADSDPGNEIQSLSISGNSLSISGSNSITLPSSPNYWTSSGSYLYNNTGSFVGIGTSIPDYTLDVDGDLGIDTYIYHNDDPNSDTYFGFQQNDKYKLDVGGVNIMDAGTGFGSNGNVSFPPVNIRMENIPATTLAVDDRVVVSNSSGYLKTVPASSFGGAAALSGSGVTNQVAFWDTPSTLSNATQMYYDPTWGRLGISNSNPQYELHVGGNMSMNERLVHNGDIDTYLAFNTSDNLQIEVGGLLAYHVDEGATDITYINSDKVIFNDESLNGNHIEMSFLDNSHPSIYPTTDYRGYLGLPTKKWQSVITYNVSYTTMTMASDKRLKTNIQPLESSLDKLLKVNLVSYDYIPELYFSTESPTPEQIEEAKDYTGVLAQEFETIFPDLVNSPDNPDEYKSVNYVGLIPHLLKAIQEQQAEIELLKKQLQER